MANSYKNSIQLGIKIQSIKDIQDELNKTIKQLEKDSSISIKIDKKSFDLSSTKAQLSDVQKQLEKTFDFSKVNKSAYSSAKDLENEMDNLANSIAKVREQSNKRVNDNYKQQELAQAKAINSALEEQYRNSLKEADAQKQVQQEIQKQIKSLEIRKQSLTRQFGDNVDTSKIDEAISKLKSMDNVSMKDLRNQISNVNLDIKELTENAKSSESIFGKFGSSLRNLGIYLDIGDVFRTFINGAKEAIQYTMDVENSMIDLRRIVDMSDSQAQKFQESMHGVSVSLASSNSDLIETTANFAKLGYNLQDSQILASTATKYNFSADINDINSSTSTLISTMKAFKIEAKDTMSIGDGINKVSNDFAVSANQINDGLLKSSATLSAFGNNLNETIAMVTAGTEIIQNGDIVGTALKSSSARITTNENALKWLKNFNISLEDQNGNLKSTYKLLEEIAPKLNELQGVTKAQAMNDLFGKQNISSMLAIINNIDNMHKVMDDLSNSTGSVDSEFNRYLDSTQAKTKQLKENLGGLYSQFVNSNMTKGIVDSLNLFVTSITSVISKLGVLPTTIATVVGSLTIFNSKFRESLSNSIPLISNISAKLKSLKSSYDQQINVIKGKITAKLKSLKSSYDQQINVIKGKITAQKAEIVAQQQLGVSTASASAKLAVYQTQLLTTTAKTIACTVASVAMQTVMSMGLPLAITGIITGLSKLTDYLGTTGTELNNCTEQAKELSSSLELKDNTDDLLQKYRDLNEEIKKGNITESEKKKINNQIKDIKDEMISLDDSYGWILKDQNKTYDEQLTLLKGIYKQKLKENAKTLDEDMSSQRSAESVGKELEKNVALIKKYESALANPNSDGTINWNGSTLQADAAKETLEKLKESVKDGYITIQEYNHQVKQLDDANYKSGRSTIDLSSNVETLFNTLTKETNIVDKNTNGVKQNEEATQLLKQAQKELSSSGELSAETLSKLGMSADEAKEAISDLNEEPSVDNGFAKSIEDATKQYVKASQSIKDLKGYVDELNKAQQMTPELASKIAEKYPDVGSAILNVSDCVDFLNSKIQEQADIQQQAFEIMIGDDENFYQQKIANNSEFQNAYNNFLNSWLSDGQNSYNVDLSNYKTLNELKSASQDGLGNAIESWLRQFVGSSADGYADDFANFKSFAEAKASVINKLNEALRTMQNNINSNVDTINKATSDMSSGEAEKLYGKNLPKLEKLEGAIKDVDTSFDDITGKMQGFSGGGISSSGSGGGGSKGGSGGSGGKSAEDYAEKLADLTAEIDIDRYYDVNNALEDIKNQISEVTDSYDNLYGADLQNAKQKELDLLEEQKRRQQDLIHVIVGERDEIKANLIQKEFQVDANGKLINSQEKLKQLENEINMKAYENSEAGVEKKKEEIEALKELQKQVDNYGKITSNTLPNAVAEWEKLNATIMKTQLNNFQEILDQLVDNQRKTYEKAKEDELNTINEDLELEKTALEERYNSDVERIKKQSEDEIDYYQKRIDELQAKLNALNNTTQDKKAKLLKLEAELSLWEKDTSVTKYTLRIEICVRILSKTSNS